MCILYKITSVADGSVKQVNHEVLKIILDWINVHTCRCNSIGF